MGKFALLVGINYHENPDAALEGCVNDTKYVREILLAKGFKKKNIKMINDEDEDVPAPTGAEVKKGLQWLCSGRKKKDKIVFHFSGHGTQIRSDDDDEEDMKDEAIVLENMFLLADDDLKQFFSMLPVGCQATVITDCCHSGGMLDHKSIAVGGDKEDDEVEERNFDVLSRSRDGYDNDGELQPRSLPVSSIAMILSELLGEEVSATSKGVSGGLAMLHGGDASKIAMRFVASQLGETEGDGMDKLFSMATGSSASEFRDGNFEADDGDGSRSVFSTMISAASSSVSTSSSPFLSILEDLGLAGQSSATSQGAPPFVPSSRTREMHDDVGVLITGCQSWETSDDVRPEDGEPHGALTHAIRECWRNDKDCTYRDLIYEVRRSLNEQEMSQNPQLECSEENADLPFICGVRGEGAGTKDPNDGDDYEDDDYEDDEYEDDDYEDDDNEDDSYEEDGDEEDGDEDDDYEDDDYEDEDEDDEENPSRRRNRRRNSGA